MGEQTAIGWTDHTFNPWWGCTKIAGPNGAPSACDHCYAEAFSKRTGHGVWGKNAPRRFFGDKHWAEPLKWERAAAAGVPGPNTGRAHHLVFCASMGDVFEARADLNGTRQQLWRIIDDTPSLDWQLLTKRPEQIQHLFPSRWLYRNGPRNVWLGTTVEDHARGILRIPRLLASPAPVHFLSCEPLLGPVNITAWAHGLDWVICGGESGPGHRPLNLDHARGLRDQCVKAGIPFFFKQVGGRTPTAGGDQLDGEQWKQFPKADA